MTEEHKTAKAEQIQREHGVVEEVFETMLFSCRFMIMIPVLGILVSSFVMFLKGCIEVVQGVRAFIPMLHDLHPSSSDDNNVILAFIPAIDNYLFATILLIISMGLYELFISKIDPRCRKDTTRPDWMVIKNLDDLKSKIGEVVVMILTVNFFKLSFTINYDHATDLLILGGSILLVAAALFVTHYASGKAAKHPSKE